MKTLFLGFALLVGTGSAANAADSAKAPKAAKSAKGAKSKASKADAPVYLDLSGPAEDDNAMPAITPKGKL